MNTILKRFLAPLLLAVTLLAAPVAFTSCSTPARTAYVGSGATHITVKAALGGWNEYLGREYASIAEQAKTDPSPAALRRAKLLDQERQVRDAYEKYQAAQIVVLVAAQNFSKLDKADPNVPATQDILTTAISASSATLSAVLDLVVKFGIKVK